MITRIRNYFIFLFTLTIMGCSGNGSCPTVTPSNLYQLGVLPNNSTLFASSNTFTTPSDSNTSGTLTLSGGTPGASYILSFGVNPVGPIVSCTSTPCIITSGSNSTMQINFDGNNQPDGVYTITVYYTPLVVDLSKESLGTALPNTIELTITQNSSSIGNLVIAPLDNKNMEIGESQLTTISLSNSSGITSNVVTTLTSENNKISITPTTCNLTTANNSCTVTINALESGDSSFTASATGYTTVISESITILPPAQFMIASGQTSTLDHYNPQTNTLNNLLAPSVQLRGIAQKDSTIIAVGFTGTVFASHDNAQSFAIVRSGISQNLAAVISTSTGFIAVGDSGKIISSTDGNTWSILNSGTESGLTALSANGNTIIAVGNGGTILVSHNNGATWTNKKLESTTTKLNAITNQGADFVAVGNTGTVLVSHDDGDTWTASGASGVLNDLLAVATLGNNTFATVGTNATILVSSDKGDAWTKKTAAGLGNNQLFTITGNESTFVAGGGSVSGVLALSTNNGTSWTKPTMSGALIYKVAYSNNTWLAVGNANNILKSVDNGATWTSIANSSFNGIAYVNTLFNNNTIVNIGSSSSIVTSSDAGTSWQNKTLNKYASGINSITNNNGDFAIAGSKSIVSHDYGITWESISNVTTQMTALQKNNSTFIGVGASGRYMKSSDNGLSWESGITATSQGLTSIASNKDNFVAVGSNVSIIKSNNNGTTWESIAAPLGITTLNFITNNESTFIARGSSGESIIISNDNGTTWRAHIFNNLILDLGYGNNTWIITGANGFINKSVDNGNTWTQINTEYVDNLSRIANINDTWLITIASGERGILVSYDNGDTWTRRSLPTSSFVTSLTAFGKYFMIGLFDGSVLISKDNAQTWDTIQTSSGGAISYIYPYY